MVQPLTSIVGLLYSFIIKNIYKPKNNTTNIFISSIYPEESICNVEESLIVMLSCIAQLESSRSYILQPHNHKNHRRFPNRCNNLHTNHHLLKHNILFLCKDSHNIYIVLIFLNLSQYPSFLHKEHQSYLYLHNSKKETREEL